jgi:peptide chain release factor 3
LSEVHLFERDRDHGAREAVVHVDRIDSVSLRNLLGSTGHDALVHDISLLDAAGHPFDPSAVITGEQTPVFFGSALTNFGVEPFLREFLELAPAPSARESTIGPVDPADETFTGFVFKIQANMDPRHRDRIAFVRICSGHFDAGMTVTHVRSGKSMRLASPQQFLARERSAIEEAWPGDVIGIMDRGTLRIGDTLSSGALLEFADIPRFPPEHFARAVPADPLRRKQFDTGLRELTEEGAAQVFYAQTEAGPAPIVGAVGLLQFDVMQFRLEHEYRAPCRFEPLGYRYPRWVTGTREAVAKAGEGRGRLMLYDAKGAPLVLFDSEWNLRWALEHETGVTWHDIAP